MDYRIAICDDSQFDVDFLKKTISLWQNGRSERFSVSAFHSAESFLTSYKQKNYDLLLLDIKMGKMDGVELAKTIRKDNQQMQIIFITGYTDFVFQGYDVSATHYLVKPVKQEVLFEILDRAVNNLSKKERFLFFSIGNAQKRVPVDSIMYVESFLHTVEMTTVSESFKIKKTIRDMEKELGEQFVRCHRSYIVGIRFIALICRGEVVLDSGKRIPLSRNAQKTVHDSYMNYYKDYLQ